MQTLSHPVWGGTAYTPATYTVDEISIHPPRVGWDLARPYRPTRSRHFNPPTPCGVGLAGANNNGRYGDFNPPTPCGVGHRAAGGTNCGTDFNPPTPCGVGRNGQEVELRNVRFQSTHPVWGGTDFLRTGEGLQLISIHPPRVGWDCGKSNKAPDRRDFNPPTPCGVGRRPRGDCQKPRDFNPPTPCGVGQQ